MNPNTSKSAQTMHCRTLQAKLVVYISREHIGNYLFFYVEMHLRHMYKVIYNNSIFKSSLFEVEFIKVFSIAILRILEIDSTRTVYKYFK